MLLSAPFCNYITNHLAAVWVLSLQLSRSLCRLHFLYVAQTMWLIKYILCELEMLSTSHFYRHCSKLPFYVTLKGRKRNGGNKFENEEEQIRESHFLQSVSPRHIATFKERLRCNVHIYTLALTQNYKLA